MGTLYFVLLVLCASGSQMCRQGLLGMLGWNIHTSRTLLCPVVYSWIPYKRQCLPVGHRAIVHFVAAMAQWKHCVTFGDLLSCWVVHCVVWWEMPLIWQTLAWSTMNIATFRQTGVCWPVLLSHFFWCSELFKAGVLIFILIQLHIPSVVFITFAPIIIAFVHHLYTFTVVFK